MEPSGRLIYFQEHKLIVTNRNIICQRGGAASFSKLYNAMEIFKNILSNKMCDIILRETNRTGTKITETYNNKLIENYSHISKRPKEKTFKPFKEQELDAFFGVLICSGVHRSNREHLTELWKSDHLPLFRAAMSHDRFKLLLRFISLIMMLHVSSTKLEIFFEISYKTHKGTRVPCHSIMGVKNVLASPKYSE